MKIAIMQPYFLPYLGYWQLIEAVEAFVIYDDVNFIKGGWINRNRILIDGKVHYINLPMKGASSNKKINEISVNREEFKHMINVIDAAYRKAPYYEEAMSLIDEIVSYDTNNLAEFVSNSIFVICEYLDIKTKILISSELEKDNSLKGQDKVIDICKRLGADQYINAIGGTGLYNADDFWNSGIQLSFIRGKDISYNQFSMPFFSNLSILDVLMFNIKLDIQGMLNNYDILNG